MKVIFYLIRKEFLQIKRNKGILPLILVMPIVQLLILSYAADFEIRNLRVFWVDKDHSTASRLLQSKLQASDYFELSGTSGRSREAHDALERDDADLVIEVPASFERSLFREGTGQIQLVINAIDGTKAGLGTFYANQVIRDFNKELITMYGAYRDIRQLTFVEADIPYLHWFNPALNYKTFMVPGILVMLLTMIGVFISSMNIVRERELGTIEQLNVSPIHKYQFILGKLIPLWLLGLVIFTVGLLVARLVFQVPFVGSLLLLYAFAAVYLTMVLGLGLLISTLAETQQQAMFISWFFLVIFLLMGGLFTAIENMPEWAQKITLINPIRYFIEVVRLVMLKGASFPDISKQFLIVSVYSVVINTLAVFNYKKVS